MLVKVFPIKLQDGTQDKVETIVREFAPTTLTSRAERHSQHVQMWPAPRTPRP
jgi:hypothetical protein